MSKEEIQLECNVQRCGTPFKVTDDFKDTTFGPGSMGLLSYMMGPDNNNPNVVFQQVVTTRRGKGGKPRINKSVILCPIFKVPGIPHELLYPKAGDTKYFVNIDASVGVTDLILNENEAISDEYMSWLLTRAMLTQELDKVVYPPDHRIMASAGLQGGGRGSGIWPKDKLDVLKKFAQNVERWHSDGMTDVIAEEFGSFETRLSMLQQLKKVEASLIIPRLEYHRRILKTLRDALNHIQKIVNDKTNEVENPPAYNAAIKNQRRMIKAREQVIESTMKARLKTLSSSRELLKM